jgi:outer membrane protein assembly factor BamD
MAIGGSMRAITGFVGVLAIMLLAACEQPDPQAILEATPPQDIYAQAEDELNAGRNFNAGELFGEVERLYPYSEWAQRSMLMSSFAYYQAAEFERSQSAARRFLEFYPNDDDAPYAQYLIALAYYDQITDVGRDQQATLNALQALREVIERFPGSAYARDSELKFDLAMDHLAGKEMEIGRYYLKRGQYMAAINRFQTVIDDFQTTTHVEEALHRMVEAYLALGLDEEAGKAAALLGYNSPGSDWYENTYTLMQSNGAENGAEERSLFQSIWSQVIRGRWL